MATQYRANRIALVVTLLGGSILTGCSDSNNGIVQVEPTNTYSADIVWTEYGIPHITANDWGSLGYGVGYAYAKENFCTIMREYVFSAGESAKYLGDEGDLNSDFVMKLYNDDARIERMISEDLADYVVENLEGYAAGVNRYFSETGVDNLAEGDEGCRGAAWAREVDLNDVVRLIHRTVLVASAQPLSDFIVGAQFPEMVANASPQTPSEKLNLELERKAR